MHVYLVYYVRSSLFCSVLYIRYLDPDPNDLSTDLSESMHPKYKSLNHAIASLVSSMYEETALSSTAYLAAAL